MSIQPQIFALLGRTSSFLYVHVFLPLPSPTTTNLSCFLCVWWKEILPGALDWTRRQCWQCVAAPLALKSRMEAALHPVPKGAYMLPAPAPWNTCLCPSGQLNSPLRSAINFKLCFHPTSTRKISFTDIQKGNSIHFSLRNSAAVLSKLQGPCLTFLVNQKFLVSADTTGKAGMSSSQVIRFKPLPFHRRALGDREQSCFVYYFIRSQQREVSHLFANGKFFKVG